MTRPLDRYLPPLSDRARRWVRFGAVVVAAVLLGRLVLVLRPVLTPVVVAFAIAYVLDPPVTWLERRRRIPRAASISVGLIALGVLALAGGFVLTVQLIDLAGSADEYFRLAVDYVQQRLPALTARLEPADVAALAQQHGLTIGRTLFALLGGILSNVGYLLTLAVLVPMFTFYFLLRFNEIVALVRDHLPAESRPTIVHVVRTIDSSIANFFRGRLTVCLIVGLLNGLGWLIVGVKYSLLLGCLLGVLNLVPFLSILALPPALLLAYFGASGSWVMPVVATMGVYLAVQAIESFVLTPLIEARSSGLHPITTVIALLVGGQLAGLLGMLLAIPITSTLKSLALEYVLPEIRRLAAAGPAPAEPDAQEPPAEPESSPRQDDAPQVPARPGR